MVSAHHGCLFLNLESVSQQRVGMGMWQSNQEAARMLAPIFSASVPVPAVLTPDFILFILFFLFYLFYFIINFPFFYHNTDLGVS